MDWPRVTEVPWTGCEGPVTELPPYGYGHDLGERYVAFKVPHYDPASDRYSSYVVALDLPDCRIRRLTGEVEPHELTAHWRWVAWTDQCRSTASEDIPACLFLHDRLRNESVMLIRGMSFPRKPQISRRFLLTNLMRSYPESPEVTLYHLVEGGRETFAAESVWPDSYGPHPYGVSDRAAMWLERARTEETAVLVVRDLETDSATLLPQGPGRELLKVGALGSRVAVLDIPKRSLEELNRPQDGLLRWLDLDAGSPWQSQPLEAVFGEPSLGGRYVAHLHDYDLNQPNFPEVVVRLVDLESGALASIRFHTAPDWGMRPVWIELSAHYLLVAWRGCYFQPHCPRGTLVNLRAIGLVDVAGAVVQGASYVHPPG